MSTEKTAGCANNGQEPGGRLHRPAVMALAEDLRTSLRFHQQLGIAYYPLTPGLQRCLAGKGEQPHPGEGFPQAPPPPSSSRAVVPQPASTAEFSARLASLHREIEDCQLCPWVAVRQGQVMGAGTVGSRLLVIGDYSKQRDGFLPTTLFGAAEDTMLWNMMRAIGLAPDEVYVTNTVKCCPPADSQAETEQVRHCLSYLRQEIALIRPHLICAMGETAAHAVLGGSEPVSRLRGRFHRYGYGEATEAPLQVMVTFHPRFLLECGDLKKAAWMDLKMIQRQLQVR